VQTFMLSVLMATYNRATKLAVVLDAYLRLDPPPGGWHLFIVDNGSTDETKQVVASFRERLPLTYLFEPRRGKNMALNSTLPKVQGDLIVFTDDDAPPKLDWLTQLRSSADAHPEFSIFGGVTLPEWEAPPEDWILSWAPLIPAYAITSPDLKEGPTTYHNVYGLNMAIRRDVFNAGYRFDETIGPRGKDYPMGSETEILQRLTQAGHQAWHCENAIVRHMIDKSQMSEKWVMRRAGRFGRGQFRLEGKLPAEPFRIWFGIPRYLVRTIGTQALRVAWTTLKRDARARFEARWELNFAIGMATEARLMRQTEKSRGSAPLRSAL
jgi:glycosyltransferase involved in cell wall biosynthesis